MTQPTSVPIFINCRDRLEPLLGLLDYLERAGHEQIYLLDNDSAYPPLLEYFAATPHHVITLGRNGGRLGLWEAEVLSEFGVDGRYVVSDPDIVPVAECPLDAIEYFSEVLDAYPTREKVGFGLKIDDLPESYRLRDEVVAWESQFWEKLVAPRLFDAEIDTTFALYRRPLPPDFVRSVSFFKRSIRTGDPYVARHTTWYVDESSLPDDELFYRQRAQGSDVNNWGRGTAPADAAQKLALQVARTPAREPHRLDRTRPRNVAEVTSGTAWSAEPDPVDEAEYTPWAESGWHSWNGMSPEVEVCEFLAALVQALRPEIIIETGTGQGFITRRVERVLRDGQRLTCYESDPARRQALRSLPLFDGQRCVLSEDASPQDGPMAKADFCILDSEYSYRVREIDLWSKVAREGAILFVHDTGNGHGPETGHARLGARIAELGIPGFFLDNPRGAFVGANAERCREANGTDLTTLTLADRLARVEGELLKLRNSKTFRYSEPARRIYARLRSWSR